LALTITSWSMLR